MIYIEVIFGSINGNAIDVDAALSSTSTNPVQNKVINAAIEALKQQIENIAGSITKDVVEVETYDDLADIENPTSEVIYATTDTNKLYLYDEDAEEFNEVTNTTVDNTIYVTDLADLFDMDLTAGLYVVSHTHRKSLVFVTDIYTLSVRRTMRGRTATTGMTLTNANGYAVKEYDEDNDEYVWSWSYYSLDGHGHEISDIGGLSDALNAKQNATDISLNTTDKTVVGAINELFVNVQTAINAFTIDFQRAITTVKMRNLVGAIKTKKIVCDNVHTLKVKINGTLTTLTLNDGVCTQELTIPDNALLEWEMERTTGGEIASVNVKYMLNS